MKIYDHHRLGLLLFFNMFLWMVIVGSICLVTNHALAMASDTSSEESFHRIHTASVAVEEAWEEFHRSAIGGTLASPEIQTQIEQHLHEARGLLMNARKADRNGDNHSVIAITNRVVDITSSIIASSRERKQ